MRSLLLSLIVAAGCALTEDLCRTPARRRRKRRRLDPSSRRNTGDAESSGDAWLVNWCRGNRFGKAPFPGARCMRPLGLARDWMREQEVAAGPVRTLSKGSAGGRHWPCANRPAGNQRCVSQQGLRRPGDRAGPARMQMHRAGQARMQMRASSTRPARDSPGMGAGLIAAVGMAVATRRNMLCLLSAL
jgi:hypothetical protein